MTIRIENYLSTTISNLPFILEDLFLEQSLHPKTGLSEWEAIMKQEEQLISVTTYWLRRVAYSQTNGILWWAKTKRTGYDSIRKMIYTQKESLVGTISLIRLKTYPLETIEQFFELGIKRPYPTQREAVQEYLRIRNQALKEGIPFSEI